MMQEYPPSVRAIAQAIGQGIFAHAYLLQGIDGAGKGEAAQYLARTLLCQSQEKPCGACEACSRAAQGTHPDLLILRPQKNAIKLDSVRALLGELDKKPFYGGMRAVILVDAHQMTIQAQNALLKTLETPPEGTVFFLTARPGALLPTIVSRCIPLTMGNTPAAEIAEFLQEQKGLDAPRALAYARSAGGLQTAAVRLCDEEHRRIRHLAMEIATACCAGGDLLEKYDALKENKEQTEDILQAMRRIYMDALRMGEGIAPVATLEEASLQRICRRYSSASLLNIEQMILQTQRRLSQNANHQLAMEALLLNIEKEGRYGTSDRCAL